MSINNFMPFYLEDNSSSLPFYLLQDVRGNDVIFINKDNMVYMNKKRSSIKEQLDLYHLCLDQGICYSYKVGDDFTLLKKQKNKNVYWFLVQGANQIGIYQSRFDNLEEIKAYFNDKYFCLASMEYGECIPSIVAGYDIEENKILDCDDYKTANGLYKALVEVRRCRFDCIYSILKNKILLQDPERLFHFLSFILNVPVNENNYNLFFTEARKYVLKKYPKLANLNMCEKSMDIDKLNKSFGINYFYFNRIDEDIENLKYKDNQVCARQKVKI